MASFLSRSTTSEPSLPSLPFGWLRLGVGLSVLTGASGPAGLSNGSVAVVSLSLGTADSGS